MNRILPTIALLGILGGAAVADSLSSLPEPGYWTLPSPSLSGPIAGRIDRIVYPTIGFPSLVAHGDTIRVHFRLDKRPNLTFALRLDRTVGAVKNNAVLTVTKADYDTSWGGYQIVAQVSANVPPGMYDLRVDVPAAGLADTQFNAVKVFDKIPDKFRFVHIADSQFADPRGLMDPGNENAGSYGPSEILMQELAEIRYLDPTFAVFSGDLLFGVDYATEYEGAFQQWKTAGFPVFMVPGNHDGYATTKQYQYKWLRVNPKDGLEFWRRFVGPLDYSFDFGKFHFVALNSYDGTPERRDAIHIINRNYGGTFTPKQLTWLKKDLASATAAGKQSVVFLHHNPMGRFAANRPFSVDDLVDDLEKYLLALDWKGFIQKWEDGQDWNDQTSKDEFLDAISKNSVTHVLIGHNHYDKLGSYNGIEFITTTTLSSSTRGGYWGYRMFEVDTAKLRRVDYDGTAHQSIPGGNLVFAETDNDGAHAKAKVTVANGLAIPMAGKLSFYVRHSSTGYSVTGGQVVSAVQVGANAIVTVAVTAPPGASYSSPTYHAVEVVAKNPVSAPMPGCASAPIFLNSDEQGPAATLFAFWFVLVPLGIWYASRRRAASAVA